MNTQKSGIGAGDNKGSLSGTVSMHSEAPPGLFITGSDTGVGKTYVAASITRTLRAAEIRAGVYKPVASGAHSVHGNLVAEDAVALWEAAGNPLRLQDVCPQVFSQPLAPNLAARSEGKRVDGDLLRSGTEAWLGHCEILLVEGAGGLMSPLSDRDYVADLAADLGYPLIVVVPNVIGAINQTLQTLITAAQHGSGLAVAGIVLNDVPSTTGSHDPSQASNRAEIESRADAPVLCHVQLGGSVDTAVDWYELARRPSRR